MTRELTLQNWRHKIDLDTSLVLKHLQFPIPATLLRKVSTHAFYSLALNYLVVIATSLLKKKGKIVSSRV